MTFHIVTIFPAIFTSYFQESIIKRARDEGKVGIKIYALRDFTNDKHKTVDDTPYGGGPGMVLKVKPIWKCVEHIRKNITKNEKTRVILTSAKGNEYTQKTAERLKGLDHIIIICGRYEGVDERIAEYIADEEMSIGKYVLTGGEVPAMVIVDSITRLLSGVLGNEESLVHESNVIEGIYGYPVYTRPENFQGWKVPGVLLSGNHEKIRKWRNGKSNK
ncbi:MAG: tRNA (guanosine(37)-N1)-methyltransferase TrmD [Patescibacteria group bacterium]|nr:tRNA (guanosine(37)-N1)-methyltransferase TrmD [Patescibacteria group bacterium]